MKRHGGARGTFYTPSEIAALLRAADTERNRLMILVTVNHGLRATETISIVPEDFRDGHLWISRLKKSQRTCQPAAPELLAYAASIPKGQRLFPISRMQFWRIMRATAKRAGLSMIAAHPHSLKHSCGRAVLNATGNLRVVQVHLGHSSIASTVEYCSVSQSEAAKESAQALQWENYANRPSVETSGVSSLNSRPDTTDVGLQLGTASRYSWRNNHGPTGTRYL